VGNNNTWIDQAERVILEVNSWQPLELEGMHDIYYGTALPPHRKPIPILQPSDRIGVPYLNCPPEKVIAVVPTDLPDRNSPFRTRDRDSRLIADHVLDFLGHEVRKGFDDGPFRPLTAYTEVIQDGMLQMLRSGTLSVASATAFSLSDAGMAELRANLAEYRGRMILRPQEISNHPEVVRRLGCLAMNGHDRG
jgi:succinyl-CoA:acetate CoA-transferase